MVTRVFAAILLAYSVFLTGCAVPFPVQTGGFNVNYHDRNSSVSFGGAGTNAVAGQYQQQQQLPACNGRLMRNNQTGQLSCAQCPPGTGWNGQTCVGQSYAPPPVYARPAPPPMVYVPGCGWCRPQ